MLSQQHRSGKPLMCIARGAAAAPFDAGSKFYTLYQFTLFC
jgi:hypothetical protein